MPCRSDLEAWFIANGGGARDGAQPCRALAYLCAFFDIFESCTDMGLDVLQAQNIERL